jgi:hypothetical protein
MSHDLQPFDDDHELTAHECLEITVRAAEGSNPPRSIYNLWGMLSSAWELLEAGRQFVLGKGYKEAAKARYIEAKAQREIQTIELERERMVLKRQQAADEAKQKGIEEEHRHEERMAAIKAERINEAIESIAKLKGMGVDVEVSLLNKLATQLVESAVSQDAERE